jgi:hypothetical protein
MVSVPSRPFAPHRCSVKSDAPVREGARPRIPWDAAEVDGWAQFIDYLRSTCISVSQDADELRSEVRDRVVGDGNAPDGEG